MGTPTKGFQSYWFTVLKFLFMSCMVPVQCSNYCTYYYSYFYFYPREYCTSYISAGTLAGIVIGSVVGFIIFVAIVIFIYMKACKKKNKDRVIVQPLQPNLPCISTAPNPQGVHSPLYHTPQHLPPVYMYPSPVYPSPVQTLPNQVISQAPEQTALPS